MPRKSRIFHHAGFLALLLRREAWLLSRCASAPLLSLRVERERVVVCGSTVERELSFCCAGGAFEVDAIATVSSVATPGRFPYSYALWIGYSLLCAFKSLVEALLQWKCASNCCRRDN